MEFFYKNLEKYKPYEKEAARRIEIKYNIVVKKWCDNYKYDFKCTNNLKYELKCEPTSLRTNNFFIEYFAYGKPSGITTTQSNYYIFCDTINYYLIETIKLKMLIEEHTFKIIQTNDKKTYGYLINKNIIIKRCIII